MLRSATKEQNATTLISGGNVMLRKLSFTAAIAGILLIPASAFAAPAHKNANVNKNVHVNKNVSVNKNVHVNKNVNVNKNKNVHVKSGTHGKYVVGRAYNGHYWYGRNRHRWHGV